MIYSEPFIRIAVADDDPLTCFAIKKLIEPLQNFELKVVASNGKELIQKIEALSGAIQVVVLDIGMPIMNGYETQKELTKRWPDISTIAISQFAHPYSVQKMIALGVKGFIPKYDLIGHLHKAILSINDIECYFNDVAPKSLFNKIQKGDADISGLTFREQEFLFYLHNGKSYKEIAAIMHITKRTAEFYKTLVCEKLNVTSKMELLDVARQIELV